MRSLIESASSALPWSGVRFRRARRRANALRSGSVWACSRLSARNRASLVELSFDEVAIVAHPQGVQVLLVQAGDREPRLQPARGVGSDCRPECQGFLALALSEPELPEQPARLSHGRVVGKVADLGFQGRAVGVFSRPWPLEGECPARGPGRRSEARAGSRRPRPWGSFTTRASSASAAVSRSAWNRYAPARRRSSAAQGPVAEGFGARGGLFRAVAGADRSARGSAPFRQGFPGVGALRGVGLRNRSADVQKGQPRFRFARGAPGS